MQSINDKIALAIGLDTAEPITGFEVRGLKEYKENEDICVNSMLNEDEEPEAYGVFALIPEHPTNSPIWLADFMDKKIADDFAGMLKAIMDNARIGYVKRKEKIVKHFIALVPMGGAYLGKISQHSTTQKSLENAIIWGKRRFMRPFVIVEMKDELNSIEQENVLEEYEKGTKIYIGDSSE